MGLSAHSYSKSTAWGSRFWNINSFDLYCTQMQNDTSLSGGLEAYHAKQIENLTKSQSLTDFCYTSLRLNEGLSVEKLVQKFGSQTKDLILGLAADPLKRDFMALDGEYLKLTSNGRLISNQLYEKFAFLEGEID